MASTKREDGPTCGFCGATLSWRIVRDLTPIRDEGVDEVDCPACRHPMEIDAELRP